MSITSVFHIYSPSTATAPEHTVAKLLSSSWLILQGMLSNSPINSKLQLMSTLGIFSATCLKGGAVLLVQTGMKWSYGTEVE